MARLNVAMSFLSGPAVAGLKKVDAAAGKTTKVVGGMNKALAAFGVGFSVAIIVTQLKKLQSLAVEQARAQEQIEQGIRSTGFAAGLTATQIFEMAAALQKVTLFGDETILRMQGVLLTFTNIGREIFPQATEAVLNMATAMRTDLQSAALQLGKALNDPIRGLDGLSRAGIQFTDTQKEVIKTLAASGRVVEAQTLVMAELNKQFGGRARADAQALGSEWTKLGNKLSDLGEKVGSTAGGFDFLAKAISHSIFGVQQAAEEVSSTGFIYKEFADTIELHVTPRFNEMNVSVGIGEDVMDALTSAAVPTKDALKKLADEVERANREWADNALAIFAAREELKAYNLEVLRASVSELPTGNILAGGLPLIDVDESKAAIEEVGSFFAMRFEQHMQDGANAWQAMLSAAIDMGMSIPFVNFLASAGEMLSSAIQKAYFDGFNREDMQNLFSDLGAAAGRAFGGPFGEAVGAIIGDIIGEAIASIGDSGPAQGSAVFGPGGSSLGVGSGTFGLDNLSEAMDHVSELLRQVNAIVGGGVELTQQIAIHLDDTGKIWVDILDLQGNIIGSLGSFETLAEAAEAGLVHLLKTANLSGDMKQAFQDLIGNAEDINQLFADLQFVAGIGRDLAGMGTAGQRAAQAIRDIHAEFESMRKRIMDMGLSAEATAELLDKVAKAEARRNIELKSGVLSELASLAEHFGVHAKLVKKAAILEVKLKFLGLKLQLQALGLWERFGSLWRELFRLAKQEARNAGESFATGSSTFRNFGTETNAKLHGVEAVTTAKEGTSLLGAVAAIARGSSGGQMFEKAADRIVESNERLALALRRNQTIMPSLAKHAALTRV